MKTIAAQYLEYVPDVATPAQVRERLRQAFELLPLSMIILSWDLWHIPPQYVSAVGDFVME